MSYFADFRNAITGSGIGESPASQRRTVLSSRKSTSRANALAERPERSIAERRSVTESDIGSALHGSRLTGPIKGNGIAPPVEYVAVALLFLRIKYLLRNTVKLILPGESLGQICVVATVEAVGVRVRRMLARVMCCAKCCGHPDSFLLPGGIALTQGKLADICPSVKGQGGSLRVSSPSVLEGDQ